MTYKNKRIEDLRISYIGGGSRGWAWTFMTDLALDTDLSGIVCLYDTDAAAAEANRIIGERLMARTKKDWQFETAATLKEALSGADFVIISILPGSFDAMASDVHLPERLGIWQSVGDTTGPGGIIRALRTLPIFADLAQAIESWAPAAWVLNYTNPMALSVRTLYESFSSIKAIGLCHEVFGTQKLLKAVYEESHEEAVDDWRNIQVGVLGLNHFTWLSRASYKGCNLFPAYERFVEKHYEEGFALGDENWMNSSFSSANRVKMDLFRRFGLIAAAGDRHLAEFMPCTDYLTDPDTVRQWKFGLTTVDWRRADLQKRLERSRRLAAGSEDMDLSPSEEEGIAIIKALCGLERRVSNINLPNTAGQIPNLSASTVVETNALFEFDRVTPISAGALSKNIHRLILPHAENQDRVLRAALECSRELTAEAFLRDPLIAGRGASQHEIEKLASDMIDNTQDYLPPQWKRH